MNINAAPPTAAVSGLLPDRSEAATADALGYSLISDTGAPGDGNLDFLWRLLDIINPLQHIPVVSTMYRAITGDEIDSSSRLVGGALFGGPLGLASASVNVLLEEATGGDLGDHALAWFTEDHDGQYLAGEEPVGDQIATATPVSKTAENLADNLSDIVWNGPRRIPVLARRFESSPPNAVANAATAQSAASSSDKSARPEWLAPALQEARGAEGTLQAGRSPLQSGAQPWVAEAMVEALDKYEVLALSRHRKHNDDS